MIDSSKITIDKEILSLIAEIDEFKGAWKLLGSLMPERLQQLKKVATIESVGSSTRIEGVKLSDKEVEALLSDIKIDSFKSRDEQEVAGYALACQEIFDSYPHIPLTENIIKQLHRWLLTYSTKDERHRGEYKKFPNHVEAFGPDGKSLGIIFQTASPFETPKKMEELVAWTKKTLADKELHPLLVIAIFIVVFLAIHPFQDGNGRLSRLLTTLLLLQQGYTYVPYSSLESIIEKNKEAYYRALRKTQATLDKDTPNFNPWLLFFLRSLLKQKQHLELKIEREKKLAIDLPKASTLIIRLIEEHGKLSVGQIVSLTGINRNSVKKHLQALVKAKHIEKHGKGRATGYTLV